MPTRFAILHHKLADGEHWDLMLEHGDALLTWQLEREPVDAAALPIPAKRIGDHRKAYLEYEGPVSGDRGHVRRVDAGLVEFERLAADEVVFRLKGERLAGAFVLRARGYAWRFDQDDTSRM
ncbi:MAG: DNA polymerase ligase N-terminal domain-containing protein [Phycisphaerae bacterium]|jgi:hypothetical protein